MERRQRRRRGTKGIDSPVESRSTLRLASPLPSSSSSSLLRAILSSRICDHQHAKWIKFLDYTFRRPFFTRFRFLYLASRHRSDSTRHHRTKLPHSFSSRFAPFLFQIVSRHLESFPLAFFLLPSLSGEIGFTIGRLCRIDTFEYEEIRGDEETVCWNMDIIRISRGLNSNYREISFLSFSLFDYFSKIASPKFKVNCEIDFRSLLNAFGLSSCKSNVLYNFNNVSTIY